MSKREVWGIFDGTGILLRLTGNNPDDDSEELKGIRDQRGYSVVRYVPAEPQPPTGEVTERHRQQAFGALYAISGPPRESYVDAIAGLLATVEQAAFAAGRASGREWVAVTERLPEAGRLVLVVESGWTEAAIGCLHDGGVWNAEDDADSPLAVTHWMPMPLPPPPEKPTEGGGR